MVDADTVEDLERACRNPGRSARTYVGSGSIEARLASTKNGFHVQFRLGGKRIPRVKADQLIRAWADYSDHRRQLREATHG